LTDFLFRVATDEKRERKLDKPDEWMCVCVWGGWGSE